MKKVWMITGTSRGLGAAIARAVIESGDTLVATARHQDSLQSLPEKDNILKLTLDVTNEAQAESSVHAALKKFGQIDVLVNNAGYPLVGTVEETNAREVEAIYRTNVFGLLNVTRAVLPGMRRRRAGHIINIASMGGYQASAVLGIYGSTKSAVEALSEALHAETMPLGIHVTVVGPGAFRTDFLDAVSLHSASVEIGDYSTMRGNARAYADKNNHKQPGDPDKLANALVHIVGLPDPPLRLPLGPDALSRLSSKAAFIGGEIERWQALSSSTNFS